MSAEFDEAYYLGSNPDIAAAVARGIYASGLEHYQQYGREEGRRANWVSSSKPFSLS
jgi:hypothetical protein